MNVQLKEVTTRRTKMVVNGKEQFELTFTNIEEDSIKVKKVKTGYEVRYLVQDDDPESPNEFCDNELFLVHYHRDFCIRQGNIITEEETREWYQGKKISQAKNYHIFPVTAYIHSGVALSLSSDKYPFNDRWDVSHVGLVLVSKKEWKDKRKARKAAKSLIEEWNMYLSGDVYGLVCEKFDKERNSIDHDSVWGFYGKEEALKAMETEI